MNWIEIILITLGISLDIFGVVICQGALVAKIEKKRLAAGCAVIALLQMGALYLGSFSAGLLVHYDEKYQQLMTEHTIAAVLFICLGIRMIFKAWKNESILEHREDKLNVLKLLRLTVVSSLYTILTGVAFGFLETSVLLILIMIVCFTIIVVALGLYMGYHFGFELKTEAYIIGGILLIIGGIDAIVRYVIS